MQLCDPLAAVPSLDVTDTAKTRTNPKPANFSCHSLSTEIAEVCSMEANTMETKEPKKSFSELLIEADTETQVTVMASLGMTLQQITGFTGIPLGHLREAVMLDDDPIGKAYRKGKSMIEVELANVIRMQAMNGDTTAIGRLSEKLRKQTQSETL